MSLCSELATDLSSPDIEGIYESQVQHLSVVIIIIIIIYYLQCIERYLQTQINSALQSKILIITSLILITNIKMSTDTNLMIYNKILVSYIKLDHY